MAKSTIPPKIALYIDPHSIDRLQDWLKILVVKENKFSDYQLYELNNHHLSDFSKRFALKFPTAWRNFTSENIQSLETEATRNHKAQRLGTDIDKYIKRFTLRNIAESLPNLYSSLGEFKIIHTILNQETQRKLTCSCNFIQSQSQLQFSLLMREDGTYYLQTYIKFPLEQIPLEHFERFHFLLRSGNNYFLLKYADYQTLEWLDNIDFKAIENDIVKFNNQIVKKLEQQNYLVNTNNLIQSTIIDIPPTNCILLSEIQSGEFLMLSPMWKYGDVQIEGPYKEEHTVTIDDNIFTIKRNKAIEDEFLQFMRAQHPNFRQQMHGFFLSYADAEKKNWFYHFYTSMLDKDCEIIGLDFLKKFKYSHHKIESIVSEIREIDNTLVFNLKCYFGKEQIKLKDLQKSIWREEKTIALRDGSIGVLDDEWLASYEQILRHGFIQEDAVTIAKWLMLSEHKQTSLQPFKFAIESSWWEKLRIYQDENSQAYKTSTLLQTTLRPYQQKGYEWLSLLAEIGAGACLSDDMGLGKTIQTIAFLASRIDQKVDAKMLIACPASLVYNWENELNKFLPSAKSIVYRGANRNLNAVFQNEYQIIVIPYGTLRADIEKFSTIPWDTFVIDESHAIKNIHALTTQAVYKIHAKNKIALSGTPITNNTFDLYAQLNYLLPGYLGNPEFFKREYATPIDRDKNKHKIELLQRHIQFFVLRRTKSQVEKDLPAKTEIVQYIEMNQSQREGYDLLKSTIKSSLFLQIKSEGLSKSKLSVMHGIMKLRQYCSSPSIVEGDETIPIESMKEEFLIDEISNNLSSNKVLIFSQFKQPLHNLAKRFVENNIPFFHFDGDIDLKERMNMVEKFQKEDSLERVFLMTIQTGNSGITLTAADYVFLMDPWWNTAIERQAIDRTHRIGQTKKVFAYRLICKDSIEEKILQIQSRKEAISDELISENDSIIKHMTEEDFEFLLS